MNLGLTDALNRFTQSTCITVALVDCQFTAGSEWCMRSEELPMTTDSLVRHVHCSVMLY